MNEQRSVVGTRILCRGVVSTPFSSAALAALSGAFDVEFLPFESASGSFQSSFLLWEDHCQRRILAFQERENSNAAAIESIEICGDVPGKSWLRGQTLKLRHPTPMMPFRTLPEGAEVMARSKAGPVWIRERTNEGVVDRVAWSIPIPESGQAVFEWFHSGTFALWLPVLQFVREVTGEHRWHSSIKACFMFDDPNLHARSYGFIRYAELADHARRLGYHVSFATIPLDVWYVDAAVAALFRENKEQLSWLVHGNDHVLRELAQDYSDEARRALLAQALRRVQRLEARSGVEVCRVMAAPHGACNEAMIGEMARFGFEAASISHGSLRRYNSTQEWSKHLGSRPAEIIARLPIFPRFPMAADIGQQALFAAYLDQPIIPIGHHENVAAGLGVLESMASQINRLGSVQWQRMGDISKTHFQWRLDGQTLVVRPFSWSLHLKVPEAATQLRLELSAGHGFGSNRCLIKRAKGEQIQFEAAETVVVEPGETIWLNFVTVESLNPNDVPSPRWKLKPILRRLACEARERVRPWLQRG